MVTICVHANCYTYTYIIHTNTDTNMCMHTHNILSSYFNTNLRKLAVTSLCSFDLLKLPSSSSLNPLILLGKSVYGGQDSLQDVKT